MALLLEICANLISLLVISTPTISSPLAEDFPSLDLKKFPILFLNRFDLTLVGAGAEGSSFFPKLGLLNFIFLILLKNPEADFCCVESSVLSVEALIV